MAIELPKPDRDRYKPKVEISFPLELQISNKVRGIFAPFEHDKYALEAHRNDIRNIIENVDMCLLEYVPHEVDLIKNNPIVRVKDHPQYQGIIEYFPQIAAYAKLNNKPLLRFDPAHDFNWAYVFRGPFASSLAILAGGIELMVASFPPNIDFSARFATAAILALIGGLSSIPTGIFMDAARYEQEYGKLVGTLNENMIRRANVVEKLVAYGNKIDNDPAMPNTTIGIFYPPLHCKGLHDMFINEEKQKKILRLMSPLKKIPALKKSFFEGIQADWSNESQKWVSKTVVEI